MGKYVFSHRMPADWLMASSLVDVGAAVTGCSVTSAEAAA